MQKTPDSIKAKRNKKFQELMKKREFQTKQKLAKLRDKSELELERKMVKLYKKDHAYANKKRTEYERKCRNEIRALEGKKQRVYKTKEFTRNQKLQLALSIAQENAKLEDTDENGRGYCITCNRYKPREELAGGHWESRTIQGICLLDININAQCNYCNRVMWPEGNVIKKELTKMRYDKALIAKYGRDAVEELKRKKKECIKDPEKTSPSELEIEKKIDELYEENERLWKTKRFYKAGSWRRTYKKYLATKPKTTWEETK